MSGAVVIERGLPDERRDGAAVLFDEAFGAKMGMALPDHGTRLAFLARAFRADHTAVATREGELVGMVGMTARDGPYRGGLMDVPWDPRHNRDLLGLVGAVRAVVGLRLAEHRPEAGELYIDGIAVAPAARGLGIGTMLLDEAHAIASEQGMRWVRLDVIDTNPRAQALYDRLGYKVTKVQSFRYMERVVGFGGMISMERPIQPGSGTRSPESATS